MSFDKIILWIILSAVALGILWVLKRIWDALGSMQWVAVAVIFVLFLLVANPGTFAAHH